MSRLPAQPRAAAKRRALVALALAASLSGCAISMPLPGFTDETTSSVQPKAVATPAAVEGHAAAKPAQALASTQAAN